MMHKFDLVKAKAALKKSEVIAFPTETVMGLGVYFDDEKAYNKLNQIKRRPEDKPYTMMLGDVNEIGKYAKLSHRDERIIASFMPGPLTVLINAQDNVPNYVTHGTGIIGIRVPAHNELLKLLKYVGKPLLVPSANRSGNKPFNTYEEVENEFKKEINFVLEMNAGGEKPSTIIDLTGEKVEIKREGSLTLDEIQRRLLSMKIVIGCDHGGFDYKEQLKESLNKKGYEVIDVGTNSKESTHFPLYAEAAAKKVANHEADFGVLICTSGEGVCMTANKIKGIRCGLGYNDEVSALMRQHNDANMIAFGQKFMSYEEVEKRVDIFLNASFEGGRHLTRVDMIKKLEK